MNEPIYLSGDCDHCGGAIEFASESAGQQTPCPLCGQATTMTPKKRPTPPAQQSRSGRLRVVGIGLALALAMGVAAWKFLPPGSADKTGATDSSPVTTTSGTTPAANPGTTATTNPPAVSETLPPRSLDDLKAGPIAFEKAKTGSLIYAVGVLRNDSGHQRFGVTVEIELTDARGEPAGKAKDYRAVIEPRQEWRFRALVLNSRATQGKVAQVREE